MANPQTNLRVRFSADLADIKQGLGLLRGELAKVKAQSAQALPDTNAFTSGVRRARTEVAAFVGTYLSLRGAGLLAGIADEAALLRGRVKEAKGEYAALLELAQRTRTGLSSTVDLYARLERSTRTQGLNQQKLLSLTESVNQAVALSYASAASGEAALFQLGQGLGAGALRGEELNSVMEQTPRLAQAIADGLGVPIGKLRELAKEGKLTSEVVTKALASQADVLAREYARIPVTISSAFTTIRNALVDYVGDQDEATGASRRFAATLQQIGKDLPRYLDPLLQALTLLLQNLDVLAVFMITRVAGSAVPALMIAFTRLRALILAIAAGTGTLRGALMLLGGPVGIAIAALAAGMYYLYQRTNEAKVAAQEHTKALEANKNLAYQSRDAALADAKAKRQQALDTLKAAQAALAESQIRSRAANQKANLIVGEGRFNQVGQAAAGAGMEARRAQAAVDQAEREAQDWGRRLVEFSMQINDEVLQGTASAASATTTASGDAKKAVRGVADAAELATDAIQRQLKALDQLLENGKIKLADFYAERQRLETAAIDAQIAQAQAEAKTATTSDQQAKALTEIIKLQRDRAEIGPRVAAEQAKAEEDLAKRLGEVQRRLIEAEGRTGRARQLELEEEFLQLFRDLEAAGDVTGQALVRKLINIESAKAQLSQLEAEVQRVTGRLGAEEGSVSSQVDAGLLGGVEGEERLAAARSQALIELVALRESAVSFLATLAPGSPEAAQALSFIAQLEGRIGDVASSMDVLRNQVKDVAVDAVTNLFTDLVSGSKSAGDALKDFVRSFAASMAAIAARALATMLVLRLMDSLWPGSSALIIAGAKAGNSGGVFHGGGIVGRGGTIRANLPGWGTGFAPRYHSGGIAGLAPNEMYAVLERGEEVLTQKDPRHRNNGGAAGSGTVVKTPIVAIGDAAVANALAGAAGEDVVLTHVRNNWEGLQRGAG